MRKSSYWQIIENQLVCGSWLEKLTKLKRAFFSYLRKIIKLDGTAVKNTLFLSQKVTLVTLNFQWSKLFLWWQKSNHKMHGSDSVETLWTTEFRVCYGNVTRFGGAELRSSRSCSAGGAASAIERRATETEMLPRCRAFQIEPKSTSSGHFLSFCYF